MKRTIAWTIFILILIGGMAIGYYGATEIGGSYGYVLAMLGIVCAAIAGLLLFGLVVMGWEWMMKHPM